MIPLPEVTQQVFAAFESTIAEARAALERHPRFSFISSGLHEDGPIISFMGIACELNDGTLPDVTLGIGCVLMRPEWATETSLAAKTIWSRGVGPAVPDGFQIWEAQVPAIMDTDGTGIAKFTRQFSRLTRGFRRALKRGRPPSRWEMRWLQIAHGCSAPQYFSL